MIGGPRSLVAMLVALAPTALPCARASAQEPPAPVTILPVGTERVQVAAVVTDRQGRPVTDLKPEDFLLLEDGKPQIITHFVGAVSSPTVRSEPGSPPEAPRPAAPSAAVPPPGRHILLAIDDLHLAQQSLIQAKEALRRFVAEQMAEDDEVAVVTTSSAAGLVQPFTRNTWALRRVIDHVGYEGFPGSAGRTSMTEFQAESIARGDPEALGLAMTELTEQEMLTAPSAAGAVVNPRHRPEAESQARSVLAQALSASSRTVGTLDRMLRGLAGVPGRKVAVLVSDGFLLGTGTGPEAIDLRRIFDASARSGVAVYCLDSRGLVAGIAGGDASAAAQATMTSKPGVRESYDRLADLALRTGLGTLAAGTGGVFVHGTNDLAGGLDRILRDADASYLLGYEPTATGRDGRFRNIEVKLPGRSGLTVRARKGYFAPDDRLDRNAPRGSAAAQTTRRLEEIRGALASLVPLRDLPVRISADFLDAAPRGTQLVLSAHVDLSGIRFERASERDRADIEVLGVVYDEKGPEAGPALQAVRGAPTRRVPGARGRPGGDLRAARHRLRVGGDPTAPGRAAQAQQPLPLLRPTGGRDRRRLRPRGERSEQRSGGAPRGPGPAPLRPRGEPLLRGLRLRTLPRCDGGHGRGAPVAGVVRGRAPGGLPSAAGLVPEPARGASHPEREHRPPRPRPRLLRAAHPGGGSEGQHELPAPLGLQRRVSLIWISLVCEAHWAGRCWRSVSSSRRPRPSRRRLPGVPSQASGASRPPSPPASSTHRQSSSSKTRPETSLVPPLPARTSNPRWTRSTAREPTTS